MMIGIEKRNMSQLESVEVAVPADERSIIPTSWGLRFTAEGVALYTTRVSPKRVFVPWSKVDEYRRELRGC